MYHKHESDLWLVICVCVWGGGGGGGVMSYDFPGHNISQRGATW